LGQIQTRGNRISYLADGLATGKKYRIDVA
jgi:hypothetical protein